MGSSVRILFFAQVRECVGQSDLTVDLSDIVAGGQEEPKATTTTEQLRDYIESKVCFFASAI
jgi:molybdopterin converting factor small subunit